MNTYHNFSCNCFQLQLWLENPTQQLTFKAALPQIEAPYNSRWNVCNRIEAAFFNIVFVAI
jgi:hypothetical protein